MDKVLKNDHSEETLFEVAEFFKVLGGPTRIKIVSALFENGELCVNDIVNLVDVSRTAVSHQLRILKDKTDHQLPKRRSNEILSPGRCSCGSDCTVNHHPFKSPLGVVKKRLSA